MSFFSRRRNEHKAEIDQAAEQAKRHLVRAQELRKQTDLIAGRLEETRVRNHLGEAALVAFRPKVRRKSFPWTR